MQKQDFGPVYKDWSPCTDEATTDQWEQIEPTINKRDPSHIQVPVDGYGG